MRIAIVTDTYAPAVNGVARFTSSLAANLASAGHTVAVMAPTYPGVDASQPGESLVEVRVPSVFLPFYGSARASFGPRVSTGVRRFLETFQPDVVHLQTHFFLAREALRWTERLGIPVLGTCHSGADNFLLNIPVADRMAPLLRHFYWRDLASVYSRTNLVTVPTEGMAEVLRRWAFKGPVRVVPNGVNTTLFSSEPQPVDEEVRARHNIPRRSSLLFVARLDGDKGVPDLLSLLRMLARSADGHLIVCGSGTQDAQLRQAVRELGLGERVSLTGWLPSAELSSIYRLSSALVVLNRNEVQPLAVLEAFASGLPVVCLRSRNLEDTVIDGVNGFLADSLDQLYELGRRLLDDDELRGRLSKNARRIAEARFTLETASRRFAACYQSVTSPAYIETLAHSGDGRRLDPI
ncbi:MAG: glycosyl transferase group 1 [Chloroflexi bacterium]|nr:glycosyl transferase group 1 [Chloroflexota bacterium]